MEAMKHAIDDAEMLIARLLLHQHAPRGHHAPPRPLPSLTQGTQALLLENQLQQQAVSSLFDRADVNKDGLLSKAEFADLFARH